MPKSIEQQLAKAIEENTGADKQALFDIQCALEQYGEPHKVALSYAATGLAVLTTITGDKYHITKE